MATFTCTCGHVMRGRELEDAEGYLLWGAEGEKMWKEFVQQVKGFLAAVKTGTRETWITQ